MIITENHVEKSIVISCQISQSETYLLPTSYFFVRIFMPTTRITVFCLTLLENYISNVIGVLH